VVTAERNSDATFWRLVIEPNCSLTWRQSMAFMTGISVLLLSVATVFALKGYWLIFPFAGLELLGLGVGFYLVGHAGRRRQVITITDRLVTVEKGRLRDRRDGRGGPDTRTELPRPWTRVELVERHDSWYPPQLWLGAAGGRVEVGEFLCEEEKASLATQLRRLIRGTESGV
jgi:uncharacterized membrane protein